MLRIAEYNNIKKTKKKHRQERRYILLNQNVSTLKQRSNRGKKMRVKFCTLKKLMSWGKYTARDFSFGTTGTSSNIGPGSYDIPPTTKIKHCCKTTFGQSKEKRNPFGKKIVKTPDPGAYDLQVSNFSGSRPVSAFRSKSSRSPYRVTEGPSPSDHSNLTDWRPKEKKKVKYSTGKTPLPHSPNIGQDIEGYETNEDGSVRPIYREKRDVRDLGPGSYDATLPKSGDNVHEMKSYRPKTCLVDNQHFNVPGPGQYTPRYVDSRISPNIKENYKPKKVEGPKSGELAHGDLTSRREASSNFKSKTKRDLWGRPDDNPGPQAYQGSDSSLGVRRNIKSRSKTEIGFGSSTPRFGDSRSGTPGPGQYDAKDIRWLKNPKSSMPRAMDKYNPGNDVPGPGSYEQESSIKIKGVGPSPMFANTSTRKLVPDPTGTPGPGEYSVRPMTTSRTMQYRKNKFDRSGFLEVKDGPSPDTYRVYTPPSGVRAAAVSRAVRFQDVKSDLPGPGTYNVGQQHDDLIKKSFNSDLVGLGTTYFK
jgi:hypothetical protein